MDRESIAIAVPTLNAGENWDTWIDAVKKQKCQISKVLVIDSESTDGTAEKAMAVGFEVARIRRDEFNHGATRQRCVELLSDYSILVFLTQDAILANEQAIARLVSKFSDSEIAAVCGRQIPFNGATPIEAHARLFNYPASSKIKSLTDKEVLGIKTIFLSNSFAAYRRADLLEVGGFPQNIIMGEDTYVAAKLLLNGKKIAYNASASVYHSHNYSFYQEFARYFDTGVLHVKESWLLKEFGMAEGSGWEYIKSELKYLLSTKPWKIPESILRTIIKYTGYRLGKAEQNIPQWLKKKLSMQSNYWFR